MDISNRDSMSTNDRRLSELDDHMLLFQKVVDLSASLLYESLRLKQIPQLEAEIRLIPTESQMIQVSSTSSYDYIMTQPTFSQYLASNAQFWKQSIVFRNRGRTG
jgi:hypothetical protein